MGLSILEIKSCPQYQIIDINIEDAKDSVCSMFGELLSYFSSVCSPESATIELVFLKKAGSYPRILLTLRNNENFTVVSVEQILKSFFSYLTHSNFVVSQLVDEEFSSVVSDMRNQFAGRMVALTKTEKIVSSTISYSGYYYYTDVLDAGTVRKTYTSNYNSLFQQLLLCENAVVSFQLISTQYRAEELYAFNNLSAELTTTSQGLFVQQQIIRETTATEALKNYMYYKDRANIPLFIGNVVVASNTNDINGLISALKKDIEVSLQEPISLTSYEIANTKQLSYDFFNFPQNLYNELLTNYRSGNIWNGTVYQPTNLIRLPFLYTKDEAAVFFKIPIDDGKIIGIQSNQIVNDNEILSKKIFSEKNIQFGTLIDAPHTTIGMEQAEFTRHALIVGTPGSGKTTFALNLLLQFYEKGVPFLAIEPTKTEYRALIDKIPNLQVFTPGNSSVVPFIINPFIPPKGIKLEQYIPSLMSAFRVAFSMESPLDVIFLRAIRQCYSQYGWKGTSQCDDKDIQLFGLYEFILVFKKLVATSAYNADSKANIETGGTFRLLNLIDQNKYIYDNIHTVSVEELLEKPTIIELNAIADNEQKALVMALLLIGVCLYTKNKGSISGKINNLIMIDEAHVLLDNSGKGAFEQSKAQNMATKSIQNMIAEIRSYGTGVIIADQAPSKVTREIVANTDLKVAFRLVDKNERDIIANSSAMSEQQYQYMARMKKGEAIVYFSDLNTPKVIITPDIRNTKSVRHYVSGDEIKKAVRYWEKHQDLLIPYHECSFCQQCASCKRCDFDIREKAELYASHIISTIGFKVKDSDTLVKYMYQLHEWILRHEVEKGNSSSLKLICNCTKIHFLRSILLENNIYLTRGAVNNLLLKTLIREDTVK